MHCAMIPQIDYMEIPYILRKQKLVRNFQYYYCSQSTV